MLHRKNGKRQGGCFGLGIELFVEGGQGLTFELLMTNAPAPYTAHRHRRPESWGWLLEAASAFGASRP